MNSEPARLILNHSTHLKGLIKVLKRLCNKPGIKTITPGRIAHTKSSPCKLRIRVTVPTKGGFKLQARAERAAQEVFIITDLKKETLQTTINSCIK